MAKPSSRTELKEYSLRKLGKPVIEINVDDDQIEDLIDDTIQLFNERVYDGVERVYLKYRICLLYTSPSPRDGLLSRMPSSA